MHTYVFGVAVLIKFFLALMSNFRLFNVWVYIYILYRLLTLLNLEIQVIFEFRLLKLICIDAFISLYIWQLY